MQHEITITEALELGRKHSKSCPEHKKNLEALAKVVESFLVHQQGLQHYHDLKMRHVLMLVRDLEKQGRSPSYIRHVVNAIRLASNTMADFYGYDPIKIEQRHLPDRGEQCKNWLNFEQISQACRMARDTKLRKTGSKSQPRPLELGRLIILTMGLCGMRLTEFARLKPDALDGDVLTLGGEGVRAKNEASRRIIPIPAIVADNLQAHWKKHGTWGEDRSDLAKRARVVLKWTGLTEADTLVLKVAPKDLRKSLTNELMDDIPTHWIQAYCGWAFKGEMLRSYASIRPKPGDHPQLRTVAINKLREKIVVPVEERIKDLDFG